MWQTDKTIYLYVNNNASSTLEGKKQRIIYRDNKYVNGEILFGSNLSTTENYEENHASDERNSLM